MKLPFWSISILLILPWVYSVSAFQGTESHQNLDVTETQLANATTTIRNRPTESKYDVIWEATEPTTMKTFSWRPVKLEGQAARPGEIPYLVSFEVDKRPCTGTIISKKHILTASDCIKGIKPKKLVVTVGKLYEDDSSEPTDKYRVKSFHDYSDGSVEAENNLSIMTLKKPLKFRWHFVPFRGAVNKVELPKKDTKFEIGDVGTFTGWGLELANFYPRYLEKFNVTVGPCYNGDENRKLFCTKPGFSMCTGDSGGPVVRRDDKGILRMVGMLIDSIGTKENETFYCRNPYFQPRFVRISEYLDWINKIMASHP